MQNGRRTLPSKYHAKCKVAMPKCSKYHSKWQVLVQTVANTRQMVPGKKKKKNKTWGKRIPKTILHPLPWQLRPSTSMRYFPAAGRCRCRCQDLANVWATWRSQCREPWANVFWESWGCRCQKRWWGRYALRDLLGNVRGKKNMWFPWANFILKPRLSNTSPPTDPPKTIQKSPSLHGSQHKKPRIHLRRWSPLGSARHLRDRGALPWGPAAGGGAARGLCGDGRGLRAVFSLEGGDLGTSTGRLGAGPGEHGF